MKSVTDSTPQGAEVQLASQRCAKPALGIQSVWHDMTWLYFLFLQFQAAHREGATKHCGGWGRSPAWSLVLSLSVIEGNSSYGGSPAEDLRRIAQLAAARSSGWYSLWNRASLPHMPGYGWSTVSPAPSSVERLSSPSPTLQCHLALCVESAPWDLGTLQAAPWEYVHWIPSRRELTWLRRRMILCLPWLRTFRFAAAPGSSLKIYS